MSQKIVNERRDPRLTDSTPFVRLQYAHQPAASYPESIQLGERSVPTTSTSADTLVAALSHRAARLRILSVRATTEAGSGHPSSSWSSGRCRLGSWRERTGSAAARRGVPATRQGRRRAQER